MDDDDDGLVMMKSMSMTNDYDYPPGYLTKCI